MFNWLKWHQSLMNWVSPSLIGDIMAGASIISGLMGSDAASSAADTQTATAAQQMALQKQIFDIQNAQLAPQRATGYNALNQIGALGSGQYQQYDAQGNPIGTATGSGYLTHQFGNADLNAQLAPNYAFNLQQGQQATQNASNATGGLVGGNALKSLQDYTQNFAGNAYQQAFANYNTQRGNIYNTLASMAGIGQSAQNASNTLASNYGTNVSNLATGSAAAQAAGQIGSASALSGGITGAANAFALNRLLNQNGNITGAGGIMNLGASPSFDQYYNMSSMA